MVGYTPPLVAFAATLALSLLIVSCDPPNVGPRAVEEAVAAHDLPAPDALQSQFGVLQIFVTSQLTDGRNLKIRGRIRNPYTEPVDGVRLVLRILTVPSPEGRQLDRFQQVLDEHLAGGEQTPLRLDVQTMYGGQGGFIVQAFAIRRNGQPLPAPPDWKE